MFFSYQKAALLVRKKEALAETLRELRSENADLEAQLKEKHKNRGDDEPLTGEEVRLALLYA